MKKLAEHLGLNPATVSVVLNEVPGRSIPQATRDRIKAAAKELNYHPSLLARSLRNRRTLNIGILVPQLGDGYHTQVMSGIGDHLMDAGYFYFTAHHRHRKDLIEEYSRMLLGRGAEALIAVDTLLEHPFPVPVVAVAGHQAVSGVTNVILDHRFAAELTLTHLHSIAFFTEFPEFPRFFAFGLGLGLTMTATSMLIGTTSIGRRGAALSILNAYWAIGAAMCPVIASLG